MIMLRWADVEPNSGYQQKISSQWLPLSDEDIDLLIEVQENVVWNPDINLEAEFVWTGIDRQWMRPIDLEKKPQRKSKSNGKPNGHVKK